MTALTEVQPAGQAGTQAPPAAGRGNGCTTAGRVLAQLRHDPRTVALLVAVPSLLMVLLCYVFDSAAVFDDIPPALLGFFPFLMMFLIASITMLRERTSGTLERLLTTPMAKLDLLGGYGLAFAAVAAVQVALAVLVSLGLGLSVAGSIVWLLVVGLLTPCSVSRSACS